MGAHDDIAGPLAKHLLELASARGPETTTDDLSAREVLSGQSYGLECYRRGYAAGVADQRAREAAAGGFEDEPTKRIHRPASGVRPAERDDVTPTMAQVMARRG